MVKEQIFDDSDFLMPKMVFLSYKEKLPIYTRKRIAQILLQADSRIARQVMSRSQRGTYNDMEYLVSGKASRKGILLGLFDYILFHYKSGKSIKTRTEEAQNLVYKHSEHFANLNGEVKLLSLASGAGREVIFSLRKLKEKTRSHNIHATCVDNDWEAISYCKKLAEQMGVNENINFVQDNILNVGNFPAQYDIVTAIGMNEYFEEKDNILWFKNHVRKKMDPNGVLIATSMKKHSKIITGAMNAVGWRLIYREPDEFFRIVNKSCLSIVETHQDSSGLHTFIVAKRTK